MRTRRPGTGRAAEPRAAKVARRSANPVLALQRSVGNHAVLRMLMRTPSGDTIKREVEAIYAWLELPEQKQLVTDGPGLRALVDEIAGIIDAGKAGFSDIVGKLRELLLGVEYVKRGEPVQFGLLKGAGGDLVVGKGKDKETVQSKYVTAEAEPTMRANVAKAVYQLSGETGEAPILGSRRVADVVLEGEAGDMLIGRSDVAAFVHKALEEAASTYPQVDLWKHVERIRLRSTRYIADVGVTPDKKVDAYVTISRGGAREADFPGLHIVGHASLRELVNKHLTELPGGVAPPQAAQQQQPAVQQPAQQQGGQATIPPHPEATPLVGAAVAPQMIPVVIGYLATISAQYVAGKDDALRLMGKALESTWGEEPRRDAQQQADNLLKQLARGGVPVMDLEVRMNKSLTTWRRLDAPRDAPEGAAIDPRLKSLGGESDLIKAMQLVPPRVAWEPETVLSAYRFLLDPGKLVKDVAAAALRDMLQAPLGLEACRVIAGNVLWTEAKARNYPLVLGQLKNVGERTTAVGPLLHAYAMWRDERAEAKGWRLAFEYDEKTPGMWQVTEKHFDMDVGWVLEAQPLRVKSIRQVKVATSLAAINDNMHHSIDAGQLSLTAAGDRRLVIYAPGVPSAAYFDAEGDWRRELKRRLKHVDAVGVRMQVQFSDVMRDVPIGEIASELVAEEEATWTTVTSGKGTKHAHV
jgi:hypothetical protein